MSEKIVKTLGIIITETRFGDKDKILTVLTPNLGKITVFAKGAYRGNKGFLAGTELMCMSNMILYKGSKSYHLNELSVKENFYDIRLNFNKLELAVEILKDINKYVDEKYTIDQKYNKTEEKEIYNIFKLLVATLYYILEVSEELEEKELIELKRILNTVFVFKTYQIFGNTINSEEYKKNVLNEDILDIIEYIQKEDIPKCFKFKASREKVLHLEEEILNYISRI